MGEFEFQACVFLVVVVIGGFLVNLFYKKVGPLDD